MNSFKNLQDLGYVLKEYGKWIVNRRATVFLARKIVCAPRQRG